MRELRCAGWREDTQQGTLATGVARDCGDVGSVAGWPSGRERNGLQPGQGATELGFPRPAPGEMQSEAARRAGDPSHQSEDPPPEGLRGLGDQATVQQPGQGATELGFPRPAPGEMQSEAARRAGDPSHQSEDPPPEGLGDHGPLAQTNPRRPAARLCAITWTASQAPLAAKRADGMWFSPTPYLRSRMAFSTSAWRR